MEKGASKKKIVIVASVIAALVIVLGLAVFFAKGNSSAPSGDISVDKIASVVEKEDKFFAEAATMTMDKKDAESASNLAMYLQTEENFAEYLTNYKCKVPMMNVQATQYLALEANSSESADKVEEVLNKFYTNYKAQWDKYLPEQAALVAEAKVQRSGNLVYLIISEKQKEINKKL